MYTSVSVNHTPSLALSRKKAYTKINMATKHPGGRPTKYKPDIYIILVETLAQLGLTELEIAAKLRITERTLNRWKNKFPEFCQALKSGKIEPDEIVKRSLYQRAVGYYFPSVKIFKIKDEPPTVVRFMEHVPPDVAAAFIWLKNRQPKDWKDKREIDITKPTEKPPEEMSDEELEEELALIDREKTKRTQASD
jgi:hypothetical protein